MGPGTYVKHIAAGGDGRAIGGTGGHIDCVPEPRALTLPLGFLRLTTAWPLSAPAFSSALGICLSSRLVMLLLAMPLRRCLSTVAPVCSHPPSSLLPAAPQPTPTGVMRVSTVAKACAMG